MRVGVVVLAVLASCQPDYEDFPVVPGGGGPVLQPPAPLDAPVDAIFDAGITTLMGRVCVVVDARALTTCADTGVAGLTVTLGAAIATTAADGTFTIAAPRTASAVWFVTGAGIVPSAMPLGTTHQIPAIPIALEDALITTNNVVFPAAEEGMIFVRVTSAGVPLPGVTATVVPASTYPPLYDDLTALAWSQGQTGAFGVVWLPGVPVGTAIVTIVPNGGLPVNVALPVFEAVNTFATIALP